MSRYKMSWILRTWKFVIVLLVLPSSLIRGDLLKRKNELTVKIGRAVYLMPEDLVFGEMEENERCRVEVVDNDPITQRVGAIHPKVFDCNFKPNSVRYIHSGSPLLTTDKIKFRVHKFTDSNTESETFYVIVNIINSSYDVISLTNNRQVVVTDFYGVSNLLDSSVIQFRNFRYDLNSNISCTVGFSKFYSRWPIAGQIVMGTKKQEVDAVKKSCREFLFMDLKYEHKKSPSPDVDYLPLTASVYDPEVSNEIVTENYYMPIKIEGALHNSPPRASFMSMNIMDVDQFVLTTILPGTLAAEDYETDAGSLVFNISTPLQAGYLVNLDDHTNPITSFTQDDLENHKIGYQPPNISYSERKIFEVGFTVYDSHFTSSIPLMLHIAVRPSATTSPRVSMNSGLILLEGQSRVINTNNLQIVDRDNIDDVRVFIKGGLRYGRLEVNGRPAIYFTPGDIHAGRVTYIHDDSDTTRDHIELRITDGMSSVRTTFPINIIPKDDSAPYLTTNIGLELNEGDTATINPDVIDAHDTDSLDDNIMYKIVAPPLHGEVLHKPRPGLHPGDHITEFSQKQLKMAQVYYRHYGTESFSDSFEFTVSDKQDPPNVSGRHTFRIHVNPINDNPPKLYPGSTRLMYVNESDIAYISKSQLKYTDIESDDKDLLYMIATPPYFVYSSGREDAGKLVAIHNVTMVIKDERHPPATSFRQSDINHLKIVYMPPMKDIGPEPRLVRFVYTVQDASDNKVQGQHFDIEVQPVNNKKPKFITSKLLVEEGGVLSLSTNQISAMDEDTPTELLKFVVKSLPRYGTLQKHGITMKEGENFLMKDLRSQSLRYLHDGSEVLLDSFIIFVTDGVSKVSKSISIDIVPVDDQVPQLNDDLQTHLSVSEGGEAVITSSILAANDEDTDDELLTFLVIKQARLGTLKRNGVPITQFTQQNVKDNSVVFEHTSGEIGLNPVYDSLTFLVSDQVYPSPSDLPVFDLNITITPVDNQKPIILSGNPIFVNEGEKFTFMADVLNARDLDTKPDQLKFVIAKQPQWGYIENTKPNLGSERSNAGSRITSFSQNDLLDHSINYVQDNHLGVEPLYDSFDIFVTDGSFISDTSEVVITIVPQNDELPDVMLQDFILAEGGQMTIDKSMIDAIDLDLPKDKIKFLISKQPRHGELMVVLKTKNGEIETPLEDFSIDELHGGMKLLYKHDDSENFHDQFEIKVSDGRHMVTKLCNITITAINDEVPEVVKNAGLRISYGESGFISNIVLQAMDMDDGDKHLYYVVTDLPMRGTLQYRLNKGKPDDEPIWKILKQGRNFTQHDVNENYIQYVHTSKMGESESDKFMFVLSDGVNKRHLETFEILIKNSKKARRIVLLNKGLFVKEGSRVAITTANLSATDETTKAEEIVFAVTRSPHLGQLEYMKKPFIAISSFSQLDIAGQHIVYHHLSKSDYTQDSFNFTVTNGFSEALDGKFKIDIEPSDRILPSLVTNSALKILQGAEEAITPLQLKISDPDSPIHNLTYEIEKAPAYGHLYNRGILITQSFTQYDVDRGFISYESFANHIGLDHIMFTVSDGHHKGYLINDTLHTKASMFSIIINAVLNDAPRLVNNAPPDTLEYLGRGRYGYILNNVNLQVKDSDTAPAQLTYVITDKPKHGHLENVASKRYVRRRFTQKDINDKSLWYVVDDNDGKTVNDSFEFRVEDTQRNNLKRQKFSLSWSFVEFAQTQHVVCENFGTVTFTVVRTGSLDDSAFVRIRVCDVTAKSGDDFIPSSATQVQFDPGMSHATWTVNIKNDQLQEVNERFRLILHQPVNTIVGPNHKARVQIINAESGECAQYIGMLSKDLPEPDFSVDLDPDNNEQKNAPQQHHKLSGPFQIRPEEEMRLPAVIHGKQGDEGQTGDNHTGGTKRGRRKKKKKGGKKKKVPTATLR